LIEHARVEAIDPGPRSSMVRFATEGESSTVEARGVVVAAGPWAGGFAASLGLATRPRVTHQQVVYYGVEEPALWDRGRAPIYIAHGRDGFYGFPVCERPGFIKVGIELDGEVPDPDVQSPVPDFQALTALNKIVSTMFRGVRPTPADVVTCRYTETNDRDFVIDRHPKHPGIVFASPCSGHGFKFSILSGKLASELATGQADPASSPLWRPRFALSKSPDAAGALAAEWRG
jgi:sarcosine oxidase